MIWTHLNTKFSKEHYFKYQEWMWNDNENMKADENARRYSFLGVHRKYSEADLMELIRLQQLYKV